MLSDLLIMEKSSSVPTLPDCLILSQMDVELGEARFPPLVIFIRFFHSHDVIYLVVFIRALFSSSY